MEEEQTRSAKALIDVGFDRLGTVLASGLTLGVVAWFAASQTLLLAAVLVLAAATLPLARNLHRGYIAALKARMREVERAMPLAPEPPSQRTVRLETAGDALIEQVEHVRLHDDAHGPMLDALGRGRDLVDAVGALLSGEPPKARRALEGWDKSKLPLVPFAILLLAKGETQVDARKALRTVADDATGQLLDALLDPEVDFIVRRRIPGILSVCSSQRAADGLLLGLADDRFEVRYACVRALTRVSDRGEGIVFVREKIIETIRREIDRTATVFGELDDGDDDEPASHLDAITRDRMTRSVENLFSLLSLILDRDGLRLCLRGLHDENDHHRGTALEYLHTVLPAELRDQLIPLLSDAGPIPTARTRGDLLAQLTTGPISRAFARSPALAEQLRGCCEALVEMGAAFARVWTYNATTETLELRASVGMYTHLDGPHARVPLGAFKIGRIAASRQPHLTNGVIGDPEVPEQAWARREGLVSFAGYPLVVDGKLKGVVALFAKHRLSADMLAALASVADQVATGIEESEQGSQRSSA